MIRQYLIVIYLFTLSTALMKEWRCLRTSITDIASNQNFDQVKLIHGKSFPGRTFLKKLYITHKRIVRNLLIEELKSTDPKKSVLLSCVSTILSFNTLEENIAIYFCRKIKESEALNVVRLFDLGALSRLMAEAFEPFYEYYKAKTNTEVDLSLDVSSDEKIDLANREILERISKVNTTVRAQAISDSHKFAENLEAKLDDFLQKHLPKDKLPIEDSLIEKAVRLYSSGKVLSKSDVDLFSKLSASEFKKYTSYYYQIFNRIFHEKPDFEPQKNLKKQLEFFCIDLFRWISPNADDFHLNKMNCRETVNQVFEAFGSDLKAGNFDFDIRFFYHLLYSFSFRFFFFKRYEMKQMKGEEFKKLIIDPVMRTLTSNIQVRKKLAEQIQSQYNLPPRSLIRNYLLIFSQLIKVHPELLEIVYDFLSKENIESKKALTPEEHIKLIDLMYYTIKDQFGAIKGLKANLNIFESSALIPRLKHLSSRGSMVSTFTNKEVFDEFSSQESNTFINSDELISNVVKRYTEAEIQIDFIKNPMKQIKGMMGELLQKVYKQETSGILSQKNYEEDYWTRSDLDELPEQFPLDSVANPENLKKSGSRLSIFFHAGLSKEKEEEFKSNLRFIADHFDLLPKEFQEAISNCYLSTNKILNLKCEKKHKGNCMKVNPLKASRICYDGAKLSVNGRCRWPCPEDFMYDGALGCRKPLVMIAQNYVCNSKAFERMQNICFPECPPGFVDAGEYCVPPQTRQVEGFYFTNV